MDLKRVLGAALLFLLAACEGMDDTSKAPPKKWPKITAYFHPAGGTVVAELRRSVYIPVYSHIYISGEGPILLAATVSIRNTDPERAIGIDSVRYYDTGGNLVETYLEERHLLEPMASTYFVVDQEDRRGGAGANFIVEWSAAAEVNEPVFEAVMAGTTGTQGYAFATRGQPLPGH